MEKVQFFSTRDEISMGTNQSTLATVVEGIATTEYQTTANLEKETTFHWNYTAEDADREMVTSENPILYLVKLYIAI